MKWWRSSHLVSGPTSPAQLLSLGVSCVTGALFVLRGDSLGALGGGWSPERPSHD